jgi:hypothetical protein
MMAKEKPESVTVMPVKGKYCEVVFDSRSYKVWKVHPNTPDQYGTQIPYDVAVYLLGKNPPPITLVPVIKDGKRTPILLPEDVEKIKETQQRGFSGGLKSFNVPTQVPSLAGGSDEALKQALAMLSQQAEQNKQLQDALMQNNEVLAALQDKVDALEAKDGPDLTGAVV